MVYILLTLVIIALDQGSKLWVSRSLPLHYPQPFIPGLIRLTYTHNRGAAFGILQNQRLLFIGIAIIRGAYGLLSR
jgi:signal peptidase II